MCTAAHQASYYAVFISRYPSQRSVACFLFLHPTCRRGTQVISHASCNTSRQIAGITTEHSLNGNESWYNNFLVFETSTLLHPWSILGLHEKMHVRCFAVHKAQAKSTQGTAWAAAQVNGLSMDRVCEFPGSLARVSQATNAARCLAEPQRSVGVCWVPAPHLHSIHQLQWHVVNHPVFFTQRRQPHSSSKSAFPRIYCGSLPR